MSSNQTWRREGAHLLWRFEHPLHFELWEQKLGILTDKITVDLRDPAFDARFHVEGKRSWIFAALSLPVRQRLLAFEDVSILQDTFKLAASNDPTVDALQGLVDVLCIAREDLGARLFAAFERETNPDTRHMQLAVLGKHTHEAAYRVQAANIAISSNDLRLRLLGALQLEERGFATLLSAVRDTRVADELRRDAFNGLPRHVFDDDATIALIDNAGPLLLLAIANLLAGSVHGEQLENALLVLLDDKDTETRMIAAEALGRVGTLRCVEPLTLNTVFTASRLLTVAQTAIRTIQKRYGGAHGRVSIATDEEKGRLSTATADGGRLSTPDDEQV